MNPPRLPQTTEPPNIIWGITEHEALDDLVFKDFDDKAYLKYRVLPDGIEMRSIYIRKVYREQGMGTKMMTWIEEEAKKLGKDNVWMYAVTDGKADVFGRFLEKLKYKDEGNFIWRKKLHAPHS